MFRIVMFVVIVGWFGHTLRNEPLIIIALALSAIAVLMFLNTRRQSE